MQSNNHIVMAKYSHTGKIKTRPVYRYDYGQILKLEGFEHLLPEEFEVHFAVANQESATVVIGNNFEVAIPDACLLEIPMVTAWLFLHDEETDGETKFTIETPVTDRAKPSAEEPTPVEQSVVTQTIAALNRGVSRAELAANNAERAVETINQTIEDVRQDINDIRQDVADVRQDVTNVQQHANEIDVSIGYVNLNIDDIRQDIDDIHQNIDDIHQDSNGIHQNIDGIHQDVNNIHQSIDDINQDINNVKQDINQDIGSINQNINDIHQNINGINQDIEAINQNIDSVEQDINDIKQDISDVNQDVNGVKQDVSSINQDIANVNQDIVDIKQDINNINQDIEDVKQDVGDTKQAVAEANQAAEDASQTANEAKDAADEAKQTADDTEAAMATKADKDEVPVEYGEGVGSVKTKDFEYNGTVYSNVASARGSFAVGNSTQATGVGAHAEGVETIASGNSGAHAEGVKSQATGGNSHAEGYNTRAVGSAAHAEGNATEAIGARSHTEGIRTVAQGPNSHAEGAGTSAASTAQHVQGTYNVEDSDGKYADIVGNGPNQNARSNAFALTWTGDGKYAGDVYVHSNTDSTGGNKLATEDYVDDAVSHISSMAIHICTSEEYDAETGVPTVANPDSTTFYLVPGGDSPNLYIEWVYVNDAWEKFGSATVDLSGYVQKTEVPVEYGTAPGSVKTKDFEYNGVLYSNIASENGSCAVGRNTQATGITAHAEGLTTKAIGLSSHAEGSSTTSNGSASHAEGMGTKAADNYSHAEGATTAAVGVCSHSEGNGDALRVALTGDANSLTYASKRALPIGSICLTLNPAGDYARVNNIQENDGEYVITLNKTLDTDNALDDEKVRIYFSAAIGNASHTEGIDSIAVSSAQHVEGRYNTPLFNKLHIVGNGTGPYGDMRSNAYALDPDGTGRFAGDVYVNANPDSTGGVKLATMNDIPEYATDLETQSIITGWEASA